MAAYHAIMRNFVAGPCVGGSGIGDDRAGHYGGKGAQYTINSIKTILQYYSGCNMSVL